MAMSEFTPTMAHLRALPRSERLDSLEAVVVAEFKAALMMAEDEELRLDESFFDAGLTSLHVADVKLRLEKLLGCAISANVLFNSPTVERLVEHLATDVLAEVFPR
jgi:acyl carrier protein